MSDALEQVVTKAVNDKTFRQLLLNDPQKALEGYDVTDEERKLLAALTEDTFDAFAGNLGSRDTKGFMPGFG
ncbi:MAG: Franean1_4349 family RiPP [Anaerolineales bacterium]|nr:Franean1_4349 family RiPP [Anaerolineales bacterium]MCA9927662.1 Franean1_4349 family RiPP [Anaerolineales bacterium]